VGDSKGMMEKSLRERDIKWICNAKVERIESDRMYVVECDAEGQEKKRHELPFHYSMLLPAFTGVDAVRGIDKLTNPRGFILVDQHQRNPSYNNVWGIGVCIAIAPPEATPVPTGIPKTGYMIESMVRAVAHNIRAVLDGNNTLTEATWNAICLADMGNTGVAFVAMPQLPPRNVAWVAEGKWVHVAKIAFEKYFMRKVRKGITEPVYEKYLLKALGINKIK
ncbi:MAG: NAD(P)/FAD-dependent oxidoreductase, partial [Candidatus Competibacteraceae bacterium]|nr:NAD(P)/FAD-dependent oxidoreductase [Candidatus Competibacteraceae bacterium]